MHIRETLSPQEFEHALRAKGAYYHIHHPYHIAMHNGEASREQIQGWVANRVYYQTTIRTRVANGCSGSSITTAATVMTAVSKPGYSWAKPWGSAART